MPRTSRMSETKPSSLAPTTGMLTCCLAWSCAPLGDVWVGYGAVEGKGWWPRCWRCQRED